MSQAALVVSAAVQALASVVLVLVTMRYVRLTADTLAEVKRSASLQAETIYELRRSALIQACATLENYDGRFQKELIRQAERLARQVGHEDSPADPSGALESPQ